MQRMVYTDLNERPFRVLISGANGFVGGSVARYLAGRGCAIRGLTRRPLKEACRENIEVVVVPTYLDEHGLEHVTRDIDVVVHCAGLSVSKGGNPNDVIRELNSCNVEITRALLNAAIKNGISHFIHLSSAKVHGERNVTSRPFKVDDLAAPVTPYAKSKYDSEKVVLSLCNSTATDFTIIRPAALYGERSSGNLMTLIRLVQIGLPLPFASTTNRRSFCSIENLSSLIYQCIIDRRSRNSILFATDDDDVSSAELLNIISSSLKRPSRLFSITPNLISVLSGFPVIGRTVSRMVDSLQFDLTSTKDLLDWVPPVSMRNEINKIINDKKYKSN